MHLHKKVILIFVFILLVFFFFNLCTLTARLVT